ncbi:MAG: hypothetical protein COV46_00230 [Deltaproteobacteria bacterium CG11_big_fil_rev_8_21_14_0_20_49_13]|nr:MAG: hypothetical protein COV46_00230 [Deltaproteobacteria bacterium CG11_big_fil_rev_8_21_14_0_20_49_13]
MAKNKLSKIRPAIKKYVVELGKIGIRPLKVIVYGSYATGKVHAGSDIDLVVISKDLVKWPPIERLQILSRATFNVDAPLEVIGYTPKEIAKNGDRSIFWEEVTHTGKEVFKKTA